MPYLAGFDDKIPILRVLAVRIRDGRASRSGNPVRSSHVRDEIYHIAKAFTDLGLPDPRLTAYGRTDPRLKSLYTGFTNLDPGPNRVKTVPLQLLRHAQRAISLAPTDEFHSAVMDLIWIAYFYLLRPGEYSKTSDNQPLKLQDVGLLAGANPLQPLTASIATIRGPTHSTLTFDTQKNRVRKEVVGHGLSGDPFACPTRALIRRVAYLRANNAPPTTELCAVFDGPRKSFVSSSDITKLLARSAAALPSLNFKPADITSRSLRSGGAMALLCAKVDVDTIKLVGRWRSDAIFRYLHSQAPPVVTPLASSMIAHGSF